MNLMVFEIQKQKGRGFTPISLDDYVARHLAANKEEKEADFRNRLRDAVRPNAPKQDILASPALPASPTHPKILKSTQLLPQAN